MKVPVSQRTQRARVVGQPKASGRNPVYDASGRFGVATQNLGVILQQRATERKEQQNIADSGNGYNAYQEQAFEKKRELESLFGAEARGTADSYKEWHNDAIKRIQKNYNLNPEATGLFQRKAQAHYFAKVGAIANHQARQEQVYNESVLARDLQNTMADVMDDPFSVYETELEGSIGSVDYKIDAYNATAKALLGGAYTEDMAQDIEAKIKTAAISGAVIKDPERAKDLIELWKKDIGPKAYKNFMATSEKEKTAQTVNAVYDTARVMPSLKEAENFINATELPVAERRKLLSAVRTDFDRKKQVEKEREVEIHDAEEKAVGDAFLAGDYSTVNKLLASSKQLSGDEIRTWAKASGANAKADKTKIDKNREAGEIVLVNDMIARNINPAFINNHIIQSEHISNKGTLINKLNTKLAKEIEDGRKKAYTNIKLGIIGDKGLLDLPAKGIEIRRVEAAQIALDDWLDAEIADGKRPTEKEIRQKGSELVEVYRPTVAEKILSVEAEAKKTGEGAREAAAERLRRAAELRQRADDLEKGIVRGRIPAQ